MRGAGSGDIGDTNRKRKRKGKTSGNQGSAHRDIISFDSSPIFYIEIVLWKISINVLYIRYMISAISAISARCPHNCYSYNSFGIENSRPSRGFLKFSLLTTQISH